MGALSAVQTALAYSVVTDKGHKSSSGRSVVEFWVQQTHHEQSAKDIAGHNSLPSSLPTEEAKPTEETKPENLTQAQIDELAVAISELAASTQSLHESMHAAVHAAVDTGHEEEEEEEAKPPVEAKPTEETKPENPTQAQIDELAAAVSELAASMHAAVHAAVDTGHAEPNEPIPTKKHKKTTIYN